MSSSLVGSVAMEPFNSAVDIRVPATASVKPYYNVAAGMAGYLHR